MYSQIHFHFDFHSGSSRCTPLGIFNGFHRMKSHFSDALPFSNSEGCRITRSLLFPCNEGHGFYVVGLGEHIDGLDFLCMVAVVV